MTKQQILSQHWNVYRTLYDVDVVAQKYLCIHVAAHDAETGKKVKGCGHVEAVRESAVVFVVR